MAESIIKQTITSLFNVVSGYRLDVNIINNDRRVIFLLQKRTGDEGSYRIDFQPTGIFFQYRNATTWETIYRV